MFLRRKETKVTRITKMRLGKLSTGLSVLTGRRRGRGLRDGNGSELWGGKGFQKAPRREIKEVDRGGDRPAL